jgi:hypothetical protein
VKKSDFSLPVSLAALFAASWATGLCGAEKAEPPKPASHTIRQIEGWTARVDDRPLAPTNDLSGGVTVPQRQALSAGQRPVPLTVVPHHFCLNREKGAKSV